jgi:hypothetical protein
MLMTIVTTFKRHVRAVLRAIHRHLLAWTKPATGPLAGSMVGEVLLGCAVIW